MAFFDPDLYFSTTDLDLDNMPDTVISALEQMTREAPVVLSNGHGNEQWVTALPVAMPVEKPAPHTAKELPLVQLFECDLGTSSGFAMCLSPEDALRLAQALIGAATSALCGEYTITVQQRANEA